MECAVAPTGAVPEVYSTQNENNIQTSPIIGDTCIREVQYLPSNMVLGVKHGIDLTL